MSHFLPRDVVERAEPLRRPHIAAGVRVDGKRHVLRLTEDPLVIAKAGTLVVELPSNVRVMGTDGRPIAASGRFLVTVETIDPFHLLLDARDLTPGTGPRTRLHGIGAQ